MIGPNFTEFSSMRKPLLFQPGFLVTSPQASGTLTKDEMIGALRRHLTGDWGDVCDDDRAANNAAVIYGYRLLSSYKGRDGTAFWIITEWDRSVTTILLPSEY
jgi:hypothetical protein